MKRIIVLGVLVPAVWLVMALAARGAEPQPTVTIYAAQPVGILKRPGLTHTWAVYRCPGKQDFVISWMPAGGVVRVGVQAGQLWSLDVTVAWVRARRLRVQSWTVPITVEQYQAAYGRYLDLQAGRYFYRLTPRRGCANCTSAVTGCKSCRHGFSGGRQAAREAGK